MEYWVVMNEEEVKASMFIMKVPKFSEFFTVTSADQQPSVELLETMLRKKFFQQTEGERSWNPFVRTVLGGAFRAESELIVSAEQGKRCALFFCGNDMILLDEEKQDRYVFYYVPLLPKAIGGLAGCLEALEGKMPGEVKQKPLSVSETATDKDKRDFAEMAAASLPEGYKDSRVICSVNGKCFGDHTLEAILLQKEENFILALREEDERKLIPVGFYEFIQELSHWIVKMHGRSIAGKERTDGTD